MGTLLAGIAAHSGIDSSGERLQMEGLDISTLVSNGVANYEHSSKEPSQIVGKVIFAKKIFSEKDCENENQKYYWGIAKLPFLYAIVELFDEVGHQGAIDVAAMARYSEKMFEKGIVDFKTIYPVIGWSIEGSTLNKESDGSITDSLAKKISVTVGPCSKRAYCRIYTPEAVEKSENKKSKPSRVQEILKNLLKNEEISIEQASLVKSDIEDMAKSEEMQKNEFGSTSSGKPVSHTWNPDHNAQHGFTGQDHKEASDIHYQAAMDATSGDMKAHHMKMTKQHMAAANRSPWSSKRSPAPAPKLPASPSANPTAYVPTSTGTKYVNIPGKGRGIEKSEGGKSFHEKQAAFHLGESQKYDKISKNPNGTPNKEALGLANHHWNEHQRHKNSALKLVKTMTAGAGNVAAGVKAQGEALAKAKTTYPSKSRPFHLVRDPDHEQGWFAHFKNSDGTHDIHHISDNGDDHAVVKDVAYRSKNLMQGDTIHDYEFADHVSLPIIRATYEYADPTGMNDLSSDINPHKEPAPNHSLVTGKKPLANSELAKSETVDQTVPTWEKVTAFKEWISKTIPSLSPKEASAFTRAFKVFQIKKAEKNLKDL